MTEILANLRSPEWWFTLVIGGIIFGLVVSFLGPWLRAKMIGFIEARELSRKRGMTTRRELVSLLREDPYRVIRLEIHAAIHELSALLWFLVGLAFMGWALHRLPPAVQWDWVGRWFLFIGVSASLFGSVHLSASRWKTEVLKDALSQKLLPETTDEVEKE